MVVDIPALSALSTLLCASYVSTSEPLFVAKFAKCAHVLAHYLQRPHRGGVSHLVEFI